MKTPFHFFITFLVIISIFFSGCTDDDNNGDSENGDNRIVEYEYLGASVNFHYFFKNQSFNSIINNISKYNFTLEYDYNLSGNINNVYFSLSNATTFLIDDINNDDIINKWYLEEENENNCSITVSIRYFSKTGIRYNSNSPNELLQELDEIYEQDKFIVETIANMFSVIIFEETNQYSSEMEFSKIIDDISGD